MPIALYIDDLARERGCTVREMADAVGISRVNMSKIKNGNVRALRFSTLESICELFSRQPGDIIEYVRGSATEDGVLPDARSEEDASSQGRQHG